MTDHVYDAGDIQVLEGLDPVRKRPGMYIGSTGLRGLHHLVYEVVDNSVDEALAGACDSIEVTILENSSVRVVDTGRGIPVKIMPQFGRPALEIVMTKLHAGGKFGGEGYKVSGGLHGVGVSVVNALSESLFVEVCRDGYLYRQSYTRGEPDGDMECVEPCDDRTGTTIVFLPDSQIFDTLDFNFNTLAQRLREVAFLNRGLSITLNDLRNGVAEASESGSDGDGESSGDGPDGAGAGTGASTSPADIAEGDERDEKEGADIASPRHQPRSVTYRYDGGIVDFVRHINAQKDPIHPKVIYFEASEDDHALELAIQWNAGYIDNAFSFANNINTHEGGSHLSGFRAALTRTINDYARSKSLLKEKDENLSGEDVREGLVAILSVKLKDPQFEGQTKTKLGNSEMKGFVETVVNQKLAEFLEENPSDAKRIVAKTVAAAQARAGRPQGPRPHPPQERAREHHAARQAGRLLHQGPARPASSTWWRATPPAARPSRPATAVSRPSCLCAARSSTWRRRGSTRSSQQQRDPGHDHALSAPGWRRSSTSRTPATTRSSS